MKQNQSLMSNDKLIQAAAQVRASAHAPYSKFSVGAAPLTRSGKIFLGCNVENISLGLTLCAERAAVAAAVVGRQKDFVAIAVVTDSREPAVPCGRCRQVLAEFNPSIRIITSTASGNMQEFSLTAFVTTAETRNLESHQCLNFPLFTMCW
jgi:cytidine deaminase